MVKKLNPRVRNFLIAGMGLGFLFILGGEFEESGSSFGNFIQGFSLTPLDILSVEQDPVTGAIVGNIILGAPDSGIIISTGETKSRPVCVNGIVSGSGGVSSGLKVPYFGTGSSRGGCVWSILEWSLEELPDDLSITSIKFFVKDVKRPSGFNNRICKIGIIEQPLSTIARSSLVLKATNPDLILISGNWCQTSGLKTFILDQPALDAFDRALKGDDLFTLSFSIDPTTKGTLCCWEGQRLFYPTEGSFIINGFADAITCPVGEHQVGFKCTSLICDEGFEVNGNICSQIICQVGENLIGSICTPIQCQVGERLVGNDCDLIICPQGTVLIGNDCDPILCQEGFVLSGNECSTIVCPTGSELLEGACETIACPLGTFLQGNDCAPITCPTGNILIGNNCSQIICPTGQNLIGSICTPIECQVGEQIVDGSCQLITCETGQELIGVECLEIQCLSTQVLIGDDCLDKSLDCPLGTFERQNVCVQQAPLQPLQTLQVSGAPTNILTILGIAVFLISFGGFVVRGIARRNI